MRLTRVTTIITTLLFLVTLTSGIVIVWASERTKTHVNRFELAQSSYEAHLRLESHSYQLFKQFGDAMMIGDSDKGDNERELKTLIREDISVIRTIIVDEIQSVGEEEVEELDSLGQIEDKLELLFSRFDSLVSTVSADDISVRWDEFRQLLSDEIDKEFRTMILDALDEEQEEMNETRALIISDVRITRLMGIVFAVSSLVLGLLALLLFQRYVFNPMQRLMEGVKQMQQGTLTQPLKMTGTLEIDRISDVLNSFAADVKTDSDALLDENASLASTLKERNRELETLLDEARENTKLRQRLLADVSHELRTPLTVIQGESDITLRNANASEAELRDALNRARTAAAHTAGIVNDLLLISRQEEGHLNLDTKPTRLGKLLRDTSLLASLPVTIDDESETEIMVLVDRLRFRQALLALLQNSHGHGARAIDIRVQRQHNECHIIVEDDGPGMNEADRSQAFSRFYRGSNTSVNYSEGFGLGLPIVKSIMEAHAGRVSLGVSQQGGLAVTLSLSICSGLKAVS